MADRLKVKGILLECGSNLTDLLNAGYRVRGKPGACRLNCHELISHF
jgi:hypothetical protein